MTLHEDDPRLTAYALGELDPAGAADVEAELADDADARAAVAEIRGLADALRRELSGEPAPALTDAQRQAVTASAGAVRAGAHGVRPSRRPAFFRIWLPLATAAAATVTLALMLRNAFRPAARWRADEVAHADRGVAFDAQASPQLPSDRTWRGKGNGGRSGERAAGVPMLGERQPGAPTPRGRVNGLTYDGYVPAQSQSELWDVNGAARAGKGQTPPAGGGETPMRGLVGGGGVLLGKPAEAPGRAGPAGRTTRVRGQRAELRARLPQAQKTLGPSHDETVKALQRALARVELRDRGGTAVVISDGAASGAPAAPAATGHHTEQYAPVEHNPFVSPARTPLSTFSIDVDTASYANVRRFLNAGRLPPPGAVRVEEMVNYFGYDYAPPAEQDEKPFAVHVDVAGCPWANAHRLVRIAVKGRVVPERQRPATNLVFLLDVSGSMRPANKLPLFKQAMKLLVGRLDENDSVGIVTYASHSGIALEPTTCDRQERILKVLEGLQAGGSTHGAAGIRDAYRLAAKGYIRGGVNRVVLCTDGDFNVGVTSDDELVKLIRQKAQTGVFLSVLGFGTGNYKDAKLEALADHGNGNYAYIDGLEEARKVLVEQLTGTLVTIAKDVKIQVEFNPATVAAYRLIGYDNRLLAKEDFNDDTKDAGDIGAGHAVTALYEVVPAGTKSPARTVDPLKYQKTGPNLTPAAKTSGELLTVKLRYKLPEGSVSRLIEAPVKDRGAKFNDAPADLRFAAAAACFAMILRGSPHTGTYGLDATAELAGSALGKDADGRRAEFVRLVKAAAALKRQAGEPFD